jgi:general secretion pathway protein A
MYFEYFGLRKNPFRITPDEEFLFLMGGHKNSYSYLKYTAWANDGFMLLTGEIGTGKTILLKKLHRSLSGGIKIVSISQTQLQLDDLLRILLYELTEGFEANSRAELIIRIRKNLIERKIAGEKVLLVIDEAQNLDRECLEEIRLLADEMHEGDNLINVILSGQPELEHKIDSDGLEQLKQRIRITYRLTAMKESDVGPYVDFRTYIGYGGRPLTLGETHLISSDIKQTRLPDYRSLFKQETGKLLYRNTRGIPRLINALSETSLVLAYGQRLPEVEEALITQAVDELGWMGNDPEGVEGQQDELNAEHILSIEVFSDGKAIKMLHVDHLPFTIGRSDENDLVLGNKTVSKNHAVIDWQNDVLIIRDCESTNGIKFNGLKINAHMISNGEIAQLGRYKLRFLIRDASEESLSNADTISTLQINQ